MICEVSYCPSLVSPTAAHPGTRAWREFLSFVARHCDYEGLRGVLEMPWLPLDRISNHPFE